VEPTGLAPHSLPDLFSLDPPVPDPRGDKHQAATGGKPNQKRHLQINPGANRACQRKAAAELRSKRAGSGALHTFLEDQLYCLVAPSHGFGASFRANHPGRGGRLGTILTDGAGYLLQMNNLTIGDSGGVNGLFPDAGNHSTANETFTVTDGSRNSMTLFDWVFSHTTCAAFGDQAVPTGPVDMTGFVSIFTSGGVSTAEFAPISISAVPEPANFGLIGGGALALVALFRRNGIKL
jgi:hypothetical protein